MSRKVNPWPPGEVLWLLPEGGEPALAVVERCWHDGRTWRCVTREPRHPDKAPVLWAWDGKARLWRTVGGLAARLERVPDEPPAGVLAAWDAHLARKEGRPA